MKLKYSHKIYSYLLVLSMTLVGFILFSRFYIPKDRKVKVIVIDPGHGGKDPGCNGVTHKEKEVALAVALKLGKLIEEHIKDVKVIYTRKTDVFVELEDRAKIANDNNADLFISIHCNAAGKPVMVKDKKTGKLRAKTFKNSKGKFIVVETTNPVPYGSETYVMGLKNEEGKMKVAQRENSVILMEDNYESKYQGFDPNSEESYIIMSNYTSGYVIQSAGLALKIQEEYSKRAGRVDKGVHRQSIWVLWRTSMPSILTEIGYLTNPQEEKFLGSEKGQEYMASCLFRAFRKYKDEQEGLKKEYDDAIENQKNLDKEVQVMVKETETVEAEDDSEKKTSTDSVTTAKTETKAENEESEKKYTELVAVADVAFKNKNYTDAGILYGKALKIRNDKDEYASKKLNEIAEIAKKEETDKLKKEEDAEKRKTEEMERLRKEETEKQKKKEETEKLKKEEAERLKREAAEKIKKEEAEKNNVVDKNDLVKNYKDKTKKDTTKVVVEDKTKAPPANTNAIEFKVQFASNDKEVDAKTKYPNLKEVWFYKAGAIYKYTSGNFSSFEEASRQQAKLKELGYKDCFVAAFKNGARMDIAEARKQAEVK